MFCISNQANWSCWGNNNWTEVCLRAGLLTHLLPLFGRLRSGQATYIMRWLMVLFFCVFRGNIWCWCAWRKGFLQRSHTDFSSSLQGKWVFLILGAETENKYLQTFRTETPFSDQTRTWPDQSGWVTYILVCVFSLLIGPWWFFCRTQGWSDSVH